MEELTDKERHELQLKMAQMVCKCGHLRSSHSRYIFGKFVGCQHVNTTNYRTCSCDKFEWDGKS